MIPKPLVMAPSTRNSSCQLATVDISMFPIPYATTPPMMLAMQFPRYHPACLDGSVLGISHPQRTYREGCSSRL